MHLSKNDPRIQDESADLMKTSRVPIACLTYFVRSGIDCVERSHRNQTDRRHSNMTNRRPRDFGDVDQIRLLLFRANWIASENGATFVTRAQGFDQHLRNSGEQNGAGSATGCCPSSELLGPVEELRPRAEISAALCERNTCNTVWTGTYSGCNERL
jgi:hypothetical protein